MRYEYVLDGGEYPEDGVAFDTTWFGNSEYMANDAGEHLYNDDPDPDMFPAVLELFANGVSLGKFEIFLEFTPNFNSVEL